MTQPELGKATLPDHPAFEHWDRPTLNQWAHIAYDKLREQHMTIEQQYLELRKHVDDWK